MALIGIDIGTTHCKAGLFREDGTPVRIASRPTETLRSPEGYAYYDPDRLWVTVASAISEAAAGGEAVDGVAAGAVSAIGVASMAESGLLVDRESGEPRSLFLPWFDPCAAAFADVVEAADDPLSRFAKTGLRASFKQGLTKLLWLKQRRPDAFRGAVWLSAADYIAYRLTGVMATDYTLAARTFAFDIAKADWDRDWIRHFGLPPDLFPDAFRCGTKIGRVTPEAAAACGIGSGAAVGVAGHDHVCAALAVGAVAPGDAYDSMGTAETLVGTVDASPLGAAEYESGLAYGLHAVRGRHFWMGGLSASGGSVEWLRSLLGDEPLDYGRVLAMLDRLSPEPTGILYFPYLSGSGAPQPDPKASGAFVGLKAAHGKAELMKAVLEGTAYELESIRRAAEKAAGRRIGSMVAVGGGTKNRHWMQIKADVSGCRIGKAGLPEATLLGAALAAGVAGGAYADAERAAEAAAASRSVEWVYPQAGRHERYRKLYEEGYMPLQGPLRLVYHTFS
ncbi:FGGY-family carbohydrate kinase [Paenibacillus flagellatus]|uniref:Carbohydrate kinase n=1 Tax=Paenibacillus flagellatus TaxID=2211139 RepID=A0A2V5K6E4_9BACL|nr:FGGY family carbohydrate kinase [Paenibacillus flagellatus]PYI53524.1 carbohydrate kinase [Paenibacillus flagellatus]